MRFLIFNLWYTARPDFSLEDAYQHFSETYAEVGRSSGCTDFSDAPDVPTDTNTKDAFPDVRSVV